VNAVGAVSTNLGKGVSTVLTSDTEHDFWLVFGKLQHKHTESR